MPPIPIPRLQLLSVLRRWFYCWWLIVFVASIVFCLFFLFGTSSKIFYWPFQGGTSFVDLLWFFSVLWLLCLWARLFICALWSPAGKELTSWLSFVVSYCEFVTFPLVSWVRCGTCKWKRFKPSSKIFYWLFQGGTSFVDLLCFCSVLCLLCLCARLFICALWSPAAKGLTSWLSFVVSTVSL